MLVLAINVYSLLVWTYRFLPAKRLRYVERRIEIMRQALFWRNRNPLNFDNTSQSNGNESTLRMHEFEKDLVRHFVHDYLESDGLFILRVLSANTSDFVCTELIQELWKYYRKQRKFNRQEEEEDEEEDKEEDDDDDDNNVEEEKPPPRRRRLVQQSQRRPRPPLPPPPPTTTTTKTTSLEKGEQFEEQEEEEGEEAESESEEEEIVEEIVEGKKDSTNKHRFQQRVNKTQKTLQQQQVKEEQVDDNEKSVEFYLQVSVSVHDSLIYGDAKSFPFFFSL